MRSPSREGPGIPLWVPTVLAATAGYVDAIGYLHLWGVFAANQSGNAILVGIDMGQWDPATIWPSATAMAGFAAGVAAAVWLAHRTREGLGVELLLSVEILLLLVLSVWLPFAPTGPVPLAPPTGLITLVLGTVAMGMQTYAVSVTADIQVTTTYQTGTMVKVAEALVAPAHPTERSERRPVILALSVVFVAYIAGAVIGTVVGNLERALLALAMIPVATVIIDRQLARRRLEAGGPSAGG